MIKLSVIIPFRCENFASDYLYVRLKELLTIIPQHGEIEFLVVDSGSLPEYSEKLRKLCEGKSVTYIYQDTVGKPFSLGGCRDYGVQYSKGNAISFLDVDLRMSSSFWNGLLQLMDNWGISKYKKSFLAVPCLYLTQEGTEKFLLDESDAKYNQFYLEYLQGQMDNVENFATCSSVMIVDRLHYLSIGGHNPEFNGHGYEDFELYHRLMAEENIIPRSHNYLKDTKTWNTYTYNGFRSQMSIIARPALALNLMVFHLWHPRPKQSSFYNPKRLAENRERIFKSFNEFDKYRKHPKPLVISEKKDGNILYFCKYNSSPFNSLRDIYPLLGNPICVNEEDFYDFKNDLIKESFFNFLRDMNITHIVFPNPYGNFVRLKIYEWCRNNNFSYICFDRGALPDSWFLDDKGFNADSDSYKVIDYSQKLNDFELQNTKKYIFDSVNYFDSLESQGARIGGEALLSKLKISGKKVLFVPLQRPSDTVIKYFCGDIGTYENFISVIDKLATHLKGYGWEILVKKHPLETEIMELENVLVVPEDTHFLDLLEACDAVTLINSGVGIYAMMMQKPCYIFGDAFYQIDDVNYEVKKIEYMNENKIIDLAHKISVDSIQVDTDKMYKFIHYLVNDFYSFGKSQVKTRVEPDNSLRSITTNIDFYKIVLNNKLIKEYISSDRPALLTSTPLFERFSLDIISKKKNSSSQVAASKTVNYNSRNKAQAPKDEGKIHTALKKINKLKKNPYKFFEDASNNNLRKLRVFFEK